jgi:tripartite-type tricarboxylate transporter receptor subunit TctC
LFGPKGMSKEVTDRLALAINRVMARPDIQAKFLSNANEVDATSNPQKFAALIKDDYVVWSNVVKFAKIKPTE